MTLFAGVMGLYVWIRAPEGDRPGTDRKLRRIMAQTPIGDQALFKRDVEPNDSPVRLDLQPETSGTISGGLNPYSELK